MLAVDGRDCSQVCYKTSLGRNRLFGANQGRQNFARNVRKRAAHGVPHGSRLGPSCRGFAGQCKRVRACAGLRDCQPRGAVHARAFVKRGAQRRTWRGDWNTGADFGQIFEEQRGPIRGTARAGRKEKRRCFGPFLSQGRMGVQVLPPLPLICCRNFGNFCGHQVARPVHAATPVIMAMISFLSVLAVSRMPICCPRRRTQMRSDRRNT